LLLLAQLIARSAGKLKNQVGLSGYLLIRLNTVLTQLTPGSFFACNKAKRARQNNLRRRDLVIG
jgi:hypothetical protein